MSVRALFVDWAADVKSLREGIRRIATTVNQMQDGRSNATGSFTIPTSTASSTVNDVRVGIDSVLSLMPTTLNAAGEVGGGTVYVKSRGNGLFVLKHASNTQNDRDFEYSITG
jgi:hypothetical protein